MKGIDKAVYTFENPAAPSSSHCVWRRATGSKPTVCYDATSAGVSVGDSMEASRSLLPEGVGFAVTKRKEGAEVLIEVTLSKILASQY